ncbi:MAG: class II fructose-bisphosphate aldolase [Chloroflexi bacterium]|nr:class II fructose-bisphosphate aldolase [Chloroflexota bacterium]
MSIVNALEITREAAKGGYAVGAFNITSINQMQGVIEAAIEKKAPLIIQASVTPSKFLTPEVLVAVYRTLASQAPIPICLHLDHCTEVDYCKHLADVGYTNIMIDASKQGFEENIRQTKEVVDYCHANSEASVEGELGTVSGVEDQIRVSEDEAALCNPEEAVLFVERTGVDIFAPGIGTAHGVYKTKNPKVDFERMARINQMLNADRVNTPLVVHGGTGLSDEYVRRLLEAGGAKFNVSTELKYTLIDSTYKYISEKRDEYNPGKVDVAVRDAIRTVVARWIDTLGSTGKA